MTVKNLTQKVADIISKQQQNGVITNVVYDAKKVNVTNVTLKSKFGMIEYQTRQNDWSTECFEGLDMLIDEYLENPCRSNWQYLKQYDMSMSECEGLHTDTIRKYVKASYQFGKTVIDMIESGKLFICRQKDIESLKSFQPTASGAILYCGYYITPQIYKEIKKVYGV